MRETRHWCPDIDFCLIYNLNEYFDCGFDEENRCLIVGGGLGAAAFIAQAIHGFFFSRAPFAYFPKHHLFNDGTDAFDRS